MSNWKFTLIGVLVPLLLGTYVTIGDAHQVWVETNPSAHEGKIQEIHCCFGHLGNKETGENLEKYADRISMLITSPDGKAKDLRFKTGDNSYITKMVPRTKGYYMIGSKMQIGITNRKFHGMPADTMFVQYGKGFTHVKGSEKGLKNELGFDLEIVPLADPTDLYPGDVMAVKVLFKGKPIDAKDCKLSLMTQGSMEFPKDPNVHSKVWSMKIKPDKNGEAKFPLIVDGKHVFYIEYIDETPGKYKGNIKVSSNYFRLHKGETYKKRLCIATVTINVKAKK